MAKNNIASESIRQYKGLMRDLDARCKILEDMINKLEKEVKKLESIDIYRPSNLQTFKEVSDNILSQYPYLRETD
jgi:hypothetical protein